MLPFGGQGANQALEDAGALGYLLNDVNEERKVGKRIKMFETVRRKRASRVQILSKVRVGKEQDVREELLLYADPSGSGKSSRGNGDRLMLILLRQCRGVLQNGMRTTTGGSGLLSLLAIVSDTGSALMSSKYVLRWRRTRCALKVLRQGDSLLFAYGGRHAKT